MNILALHEAHAAYRAQFGEIRGNELVARYDGGVLAEHRALRETAGVMDLSYRSRVCLLGADRKKFLHGQVTNQVNELQTGQGVYAALVTAKGKLQSDLFIYCLPDELLLDFEPGYASVVCERLEKYVIADDVQVVPVEGAYGHLSIQGPRSAEVLAPVLGIPSLPPAPNQFLHLPSADHGDLYVMNRPRTGSVGWDVFAPTEALSELFTALGTLVEKAGGMRVGWDALELARVEAAIPRFGQDMDETHLPPEAGLESTAVSYNKGCYIGQEVIARIRTYGQVAKALRGLRLEGSAQVLPRKGDKIHWGEKEIGYVTTAIASPALKSNLALAYLRREHNQIGAEVMITSGSEQLPATVATLPFVPFLPK